MINIHPETGDACPSQPLSLIKRHREGPPQFGIASLRRTCVRTCAPAHCFRVGIIAEVDSDAFSSDGITVRVGDLITPVEVSTPGQTAHVSLCSSAVVFGLRPRFWLVKSLQSHAAQACSSKPGFAPFFIFAALCSFTAASVVWAKYRKYR